jgi:hypothetical protein
MALCLMMPSFRRALAASKVESARGAATKEQATAILDRFKDKLKDTLAAAGARDATFSGIDVAYRNAPTMVGEDDAWL